MTVRVYVEVAPRRTFACALDWPGWARSGRGEQAAIEALEAYRDRYACVVGKRVTGRIEVTERLDGDAGTEFGAPCAVPSEDARPLDARELARLVAMLRACWAHFDDAAARHARAELRKGPRGGGRDMDKIVDHVLEADGAYLVSVGGSRRKGMSMADVRDSIVRELGARARGEPPAKPRARMWPPRYAVRRSAWHALDHAWEIEDRARD